MIAASQGTQLLHGLGQQVLDLGMQIMKPLLLFFTLASVVFAQGLFRSGAGSDLVVTSLVRITAARAATRVSA